MLIQIMFKILIKTMGISPSLVIVSKEKTMEQAIRDAFPGERVRSNAPVGQTTSGMYFPDNNLILIKDQGEWDRNLAVLSHECRHAWQKKQGWNMASLLPYDMDPCEVDAQHFTRTIMNIVGVVVGASVGLALHYVLKAAVKAASKKEV